MSVTVRVPSALRKLTDGQAELAAAGSTVRELFDDLGAKHPDLLKRIPGAQLQELDDPQRRRPLVQRALHDWFCAIADQRPLAIGVDDVDQIDEPSSAFAALLTDGIGKRSIALISTAQAIEWSDLDAVGKSAARFDFVKLENLNGHYLREADSQRLVEEVVPRLEKQLGRPLSDTARRHLQQGMDGLKARAKNLVELAENSLFYVVDRPLAMNAKAEKILTPEARRRLAGLQAALAALPEWNEAAIEEAVRVFAESENCKLGDAAQPLRAALTGSNVSPGIFEVMAVLGREESLARIADQSAAA